MNTKDNLDRILSTDHNTRLTKVSNQKVPMKIVLQNVQLTNMSTGYDTSGSPLQEAYSFLARDIYFTLADESTNPLANINVDPATQPTGSDSGTSNTPNTEVSGGGAGRVTYR